MTTTTTLMPLDPALSPQHVSRILTIAADLLPEEVVASRRARRTRSFVLVIVGIVILAMGGWYLVAENGTSDANADLESVTTQQTRLQRQQAGYADVVDVQAETLTIGKQLKTLLASDIQWAALIDRLRDAGTDSGVTVAGIAAVLDKDGATAAVPSLPSASGVKSIGTVTITGSAPDKPSVAKYVDLLNTLPTVTDPFVNSVAATDNAQVQFSLTVNVSDDARCGRFSTKCKSTGGK